jgi:hypothetical protein
MEMLHPGSTTNGPPGPGNDTVIDRITALRWARVLAALTGVVELVANFADFAVLTRWEGFAVLAIAAAFLICASYTSSGRVVAVTTVVATAVAALIVATLPASGPVSPAPATDDSHQHQPAKRHKQRPKPKLVAIDSGAMVTRYAWGWRWVLFAGGLVRAYDDSGARKVRFSIHPAATDMIACDGALVITYGDGWVGRFDRITGKRIAHYHFGWGSHAVVCGDGSVWVSKPGAKAIVRLRSRSLTLRYELVIKIHADTLAFGNHTLWATDQDADTVIGIAASDRHVVARLVGLDDPKQVVPTADGPPWILHGADSCLMRLDIAAQREIGPGVTLGKRTARVIVRDGLMYAIDGVDGSLRVIDTRTGKLAHPAVTLGADLDLVDLDEHAGTVHAIDVRGKLVLARPAVVERGPRAKTPARARDCPKDAG